MQSQFQIWDGRMVLEIDIFVLDAAPSTFDECIAQGSLSAIYADPDGGHFQDAGEHVCCELGSLVGVEDVWLALFQCLPERDPTGKPIQGVR